MTPALNVLNCLMLVRPPRLVYTCASFDFSPSPCYRINYFDIWPSSREAAPLDYYLSSAAIPQTLLTSPPLRATCGGEKHSLFSIRQSARGLVKCFCSPSLSLSLSTRSTIHRLSRSLSLHTAAREELSQARTTIRTYILLVLPTTTLSHHHQHFFCSNNFFHFPPPPGGEEDGWVDAF